MFSQREFSSALIIGFAVCSSGQALAQATVFPSLAVGELSSFAVESHPINYYPTGSSTSFSKQISFSLSEEADIRIDMRMLSAGFKYNSITLVGHQFKLFNDTHTLLGTSAADADFENHGSYQCTEFASVWCVNQGVTLAQQLAAGNYLIEFSSNVSGTRASDVYFGVAKNEPAVLTSYLGQMTPAGAVPESSTWAMMALGLLGLGAGVRKHRQGTDSNL